MPNCQRTRNEQPTIIFKKYIVSNETDEVNFLELHNLITKIVTLGWKKGRPSKKEIEGYKYAA